MNGRFFGMDAGTMSEAYSGAASDGLMDGVDFAPNATGSDYGSSAPGDVTLRLAWGIIIGALALLWLLGGIVFKVSTR